MATATHRTPSARLAGRASCRELLRLLGEQHGMLHARMEALRKSVPARMFGVIDDEEHVLDDEELYVGVSVLELTSRTVQGIEIALRRAEAGQPGTCSDCKSRISPARLKALPFADLCRDCQENRDRRTGSRLEVPGRGTLQPAEGE